MLIASESLPLRISGDLAESLLAHIEAGDDARIDELRELLGTDYLPREVRWIELQHLQGRLVQP